MHISLPRDTLTVRSAQVLAPRPRIAFVVGCARSGTSILGELIAAHPDVAYVFEPHELWESVGTGPGGSHRLTKANATPAVRTRIRAWFADQRGDKRLIVEKTPRNVLRVPFLRAVFPEAKFIHIVRDGRDVACSLLPGIGGDEWSHLRPPSWQRLLDEHSGIMRCALAWRDVMEIALADLSMAPHLQVRYEHLVSDPSATARAVLTYLELDETSEVMAFCEKIQDRTADSYHARMQDRWFRDDHTVRVGRWRENLDPDERDAVTMVLGDLLAELGYR
jgi:hypothetical protein